MSEENSKCPEETVSRERKPTEKGKQMREEEAKRHLKAFLRAYESWKQIARESRSRLKRFCLKEDLDKINQHIQSGYDRVNQNYEPLQRNSLSTPEIVQKLDACNTLTTEICDLVSKRLDVSLVQETFKKEAEKERVRMILSREEYESVFGGTSTESVISEESIKLDNLSSTSSKASSKRADAEADLAAKLEQAKSIEEIQVQQAKLIKLESEWKLHESQIRVEMKQKQAEVELKLEEEKTKLKMLQASVDVRVAAARVRTHNKLEGNVENMVGEPNTASVVRTTPAIYSNRQLDTGVSLFQSQPSSQSVTANLAEAIASSLSLNRLPVPEPTMFTGDPLKFVDFQMSFTTLIDRKPISASEKMLYLKSYLSGEARKDSFTVALRMHMKVLGQF